MLIYILLILSGIWLFMQVTKSHGVEHIPGPSPSPIIGNIHQIKAGQIHKQLLKWAHQFGDVYKIVLGNTPVVILTGFNAMHQALVVKGNDFKGRPLVFRSQLFGDFKDVCHPDDSPARRQQKKIMSLQLKAYGSGIKRIENITSMVLLKLMNQLEIKQSLNLHDFIEKCICHITYIAVFERELIDVEEEKTIISMKNDVIDGLSPDNFGQYLDRFPWLRYFGHPTYKIFCQFRQKLATIYNKWKELELPKLNDKTTTDGNMVFKLLKYMHGENSVNIDDVNVQVTLFAMFGAGISTSTETLTSFFNIIVHYPDVQKKIQNELDSVISIDTIQIDDKANMPYTQAAILELNRFTSVVPILIPHKTMRDTEIEGLKIPANTEVWLNNWAQNHDEHIWDEPFTFKPERFLDDTDGNLVLADHPNRMNMMAFGAGPRVCPGEVFALTRMFLIITMMLQRFNFLPAGAIEEQPSCDPRDMTIGLVMNSPEYKVRLSDRKSL